MREGVCPFPLTNPIGAMKKLLTIALCAFFACQAGARTIYVDAKRPNNNGNGLSAKKAKKTIQAAINIAKAGDTIIVLPGTYAPITTKNRKITIKAKSGPAKTTIQPKPSSKSGIAIAKLGKTWKKGKTNSGEETKGTNTTLAGFTLQGNDDDHIGLSGGTGKSCIVQGCHNFVWQQVVGVVCRSKLTGCTIRNCADHLSNDSTFVRCKILGNSTDNSQNHFFNSTFANCLFACNGSLDIGYCTLANCTLADNGDEHIYSTKAYNTVFHKVGAAQFKSKKENKLKNCYKGANPKFVSTKTTVEKWVADPYGWEKRIIGAEVEWDDNDSDYGTVTVSGTTDTAILAAAKAKVGKTNVTYAILEYEYEYGDYETVELPGDYRLAKGSPCINKGKLTKSLKKLVGSKDLAGKKRIKGKIDIGCYEY